MLKCSSLAGSFKSLICIEYFKVESCSGDVHENLESWYQKMALKSCPVF